MNFQGVEAPSQAAPVGRYKIKIDKAEAKFSKNQRPMIEVVSTIVEGDHQGKKIWDYLLTDGGPGAFYSKQRLKGLIGSRVNQEIPDSMIADEILGLVLLADLTVEARKDASGVVQSFETDDGRIIPLTSNKIGSYYRMQPTASVPAVQAQPAQYQSPPMQQAYAQVPQQAAPQYTQATSGYVQQVPPAQPQYAPQAAPQYAQQAQGYAQPQTMQAQQPMQAQGFNPANAVPLAQQAPQAQVQHQAPAGAEVMPGFNPNVQQVQPANAQNLQQGQVANGGVAPWVAAQVGVAGAPAPGAEAGAAGAKRGKKG